MHSASTLAERAPQGLGTFALPVSVRTAGAVRSPYFQPRRLSPVTAVAPEVGTGRDIRLIPASMIKALIGTYTSDGDTYDATALIKDTNDASVGITLNAPISIVATDTNATIRAAAEAAITTYCTNNSLPVPTVFDWMFMTPSDTAALIVASLPAAAASYQTIVSQTGTAVPAVSGSLSPMSTYATGTTFTWARTSAGVYTLTASAAVFNTSGKTAVRVGLLNNANGAVTAVVTSSTVITLTFYVQSLAFLGLLGFTATPTDALLTKTLIEVLTYS